MKLALAPAIWLVYFNVVYVLLSLACSTEVSGRTFLGMGVVPAGVAIATVAALALIAAGAWGDLRRLRAAGGGSTPLFVARASALLAALSALAVIWVAYPAFMLPPCAS